MTTLSISVPEDVVNLALARAGFVERINSLYDGTMLAKKARDIYSQTRDDMIRNGEWEFAESVVTAVAVPAWFVLIEPNAVVTVGAL
jgi:hypothetical protein